MKINIKEFELLLLIAGRARLNVDTQVFLMFRAKIFTYNFAPYGINCLQKKKIEILFRFEPHTNSFSSAYKFLNF